MGFYVPGSWELQCFWDFWEVKMVKILPHQPSTRAMYIPIRVIVLNNDMLPKNTITVTSTRIPSAQVLGTRTPREG